MKVKKTVLKCLSVSFFLVAMSIQSLAWADARLDPPAPVIPPPPVSPLEMGGLFFDNLSTGGDSISHLGFVINSLGSWRPSQLACQYYTRFEDLIDPITRMRIGTTTLPHWEDGRLVKTSANTYVCEPNYSFSSSGIALSRLSSVGAQVFPISDPSSAVISTSAVSDGVPPSTSFFNISGDYYIAADGRKYVGSSINLSVNVADVGSGIRNCSYQLSDMREWVDFLPTRTADSSTICDTRVDVGSISPLNLAMSARDNVWGTSVTGSVRADGDHNKPVSQISALAPTQNSNTFILTYNASDGDGPIVISGVKNVDLYSRHRLNSTSSWIEAPVSGPFTDGSIPVTVSQNGEYQFYTRARDNVNNLEDVLAFEGATSTRIVSTTVNAAVVAGPALTLNPASLPDFPNTVVGQTSAAVTIQISNPAPATAPLTLGVLNLLGTNANQFNFSGCSGATIAVGAAPCVVTVTFRPTSAGLMNAQLQIPSATGTAMLINLRGTGVDSTAPDFDFTLTSAPSITLGRNATSAVNLTVTRRNGFTGDVVVTVSSSNPGITADTLTIPAAATTGVLTLRTNGTIENNTYTVNVIGTSSGISHAVSLSVGVNTSITTPPASGGGGGCSLVADSASSFALFSWMIALVSLLGFRIRK